MPNNANAAKNNIRLSILIWPVWLLLALLALLLACKEKDVPHVNDVEEIIRYAQETYEGKLLFGADSLVLPEAYKIYPDTADYRDSLLSRTREYDVFLGNGEEIYEHFGLLREAVLVQKDVLTVKRSRIVAGVETDTVVQDREIRRYGAFLKLGDDSNDFVGWLLWGYNGIGELDPVPIFTVTKPDQSVIEAESFSYQDTLIDTILKVYLPRFTRLQSLDTVTAASKLVLEAKKRGSNNLEYFHLYTAPGIDRYRQFSMNRLGTNSFVDTLQTPSGVPRRFSVIFVQTFFETQDKKFIRGFFIPYQVVQ
ncbi:MAG: hypothetical protein AB1644_02880 [Candidatus Zixiibacteriota bacterium]